MIPTHQLVLAYLALALLVTTAAGMIVRGRAALCWCFFVELFAMMTTGSLAV